MRIVSVNVGRPREFVLNGRTHSSAIWKEPVHGRVRVRGINIDGDDQADRSVHGGDDKAVYAYATEDCAWWASELGRAVAPGTFGENLTTEDIDLQRCVVGERWSVGTAVFEVAQPRLPCFKLGVRMEDPTFPKRFSRAERWGAYLRIIDEGEVGGGDEIKLLSRPDHGVTIELIGAAYYRDRARAPDLLNAPQLPARWRTWVNEKAMRGTGEV